MENENVTKSEEEEEILFNPYNPLNVEINLKDIKNILSSYGVNYNIRPS